MDLLPNHFQLATCLEVISQTSQVCLEIFNLGLHLELLNLGDYLELLDHPLILDLLRRHLQLEDYLDLLSLIRRGVRQLLVMALLHQVQNQGAYLGLLRQPLSLEAYLEPPHQRHKLVDYLGPLGL